MWQLGFVTYLLTYLRIYTCKQFCHTLSYNKEMERSQVKSLKRVLALLDSRQQPSIVTFPTVIVAIWGAAHQFCQEVISLTNSGQRQSQGPNKISCDDQSKWTFIRQHQPKQSYNDGGNEKHAFCSFQAIFSTHLLHSDIRRGSKFDKTKVVTPDN